MFTEQLIIKDYTDIYNAVMHFDKNKNEYIHQWYSFVEGYSSDFIKHILNDLSFSPECCLDPFSGSGTTPLELQKRKIKCYSFEVNPFMYNLSKVKLRTDYTLSSLKKNIDFVKTKLVKYPQNIYQYIPIPKYSTITQKDNLNKWVFDESVMLGITDIKYIISQINDYKYRELFRIVMASILQSISNVYRNGKCFSYKKNFVNRKKVNRIDVHNIFVEKLINIVAEDIKKLDNYKRKQGQLFSNYKNCYYGNVLEQLNLVQDQSIDLTITSPPYLNSRDYTDTYMIELWTLDYFKDYNDVRELRKKTIKSHVQIKWKNIKCLNIPLLNDTIEKIENYKKNFWNTSLIDMIAGYFSDMNDLFKLLNRKFKKGGIIYFNIANSAYYGVVIPCELIISSIAEKNGFKTIEIREARKIYPSSQQSKIIPFLIENVIIMKKN